MENYEERSGSLRLTGESQPSLSCVEAVVLGECRRIIGNPHAALDDDFFDAGGDSLAALELATRLERCVDFDVVLQHVLDSANMRLLALQVHTELLKATPAEGELA